MPPYLLGVGRGHKPSFKHLLALFLEQGETET